MDLSTLAFLACGLILLVFGAEALVRSATRISVAVGISPLVVGLTVVAFGTSAPELAVTVQAATTGNSGLGLGNVVGSNISNVLLILGLSAAIAPLVVAQKLVRLEAPLLIVVSLVVWAMARDGAIGRIEGSFLFAGAAAYTAFVVRQSRRETPVVRDEYERSLAAFDVSRTTRRALLMHTATIVVALIMLVMGARWLVRGALEIGDALGISDLIAGLTIVAIGTSLPEIATTVVATLRGQRDIAVGNAVGSNLFNLLLVLGVGAVASPDGIAVAPSALRFDLPVMLAVTVACLPIFFTGSRISRWEGGLFLALYAAYLSYLVLFATQHALLPAFSLTMMAFVIPLIALGLTVSVLHHLGRHRAGHQ